MSKHIVKKNDQPLGAKSVARPVPNPARFANGGNVFVYAFHNTMPVRSLLNDSLPCSACQDHLFQALRGASYCAGDPNENAIVIRGCPEVPLPTRRNGRRRKRSK